MNEAAENQDAGGNDNASWRDSLSDDLKGSLTLEKFNSVEALAKSYTEIEKKIGTDTVLIPTESSSEDDVNSFLNRAGRPDKPEGYSLTLPEGGEMSDTDLANFREDLWKAGVSQKRAQDMLSNTYERNKLADEQAIVDDKKAIEVRTEENLRNLRTEWGSAHYDNNMKIAKDSIIEHGGEDLWKMLTEKNLDTEPSILLAFAKVAKERGSDKLPDVNNSEGYQTTGDLEKRKSEIMDNLDGPFYHKGHADHDKAVKEYGEITKQLTDAADDNA